MLKLIKKMIIENSIILILLLSCMLPIFICVYYNLSGTFIIFIISLNIIFVHNIFVYYNKSGD